LKPRRAKKGADEVTFVLRRCALFYRASGFSEAWLKNEWNEALTWARKQKVKAKIYRAGPVAEYRAICEQWIRDPDYLNAAGNPLPLPLTGAISIKSLIRTLGLQSDPKEIIAALEKIGSVKRFGKKRFLLVEKMFRTRPNAHVAYETYAQFLAHAVKAATMPLHVSKDDKYSHWLTATRERLSNAEVREFIAFVKRRSQPLMLEVDDALNAAAQRKRPKRDVPTNTVGAGIFTFVTEPNSP
jgi:hypothetical protein